MKRKKIAVSGPKRPWLQNPFSEKFSNKKARLSIILVEKKEIMRFGTKKAAVAGPDFSIAPKWRPRCQIRPNHGTYVEGPRP